MCKRLVGRVIAVVVVVDRRRHQLLHLGGCHKQPLSELSNYYWCWVGRTGTSAADAEVFAAIDLLPLLLLESCSYTQSENCPEIRWRRWTRRRIGIMLERFRMSSVGGGAGGCCLALASGCRAAVQWRSCCGCCWPSGLRGGDDASCVCELIRTGWVELLLQKMMRGLRLRSGVVSYWGRQFNKIFVFY